MYIHDAAVRKYGPAPKDFVEMSELQRRQQMKIKITIYTKKGEVHSYENVNKCDIHNVGPGLLTFLHDDRYIEYYRLGTIDRWTVEEETKNE